MASLTNLNLFQKVAQCVFPRLNISQYESDIHYKNNIIELAKIGCGGFCIFEGKTESVKKITAELQFYAEIPLLFCADFEHGLPMRLEDGTAFPHHFALAKANKHSLPDVSAPSAQAQNDKPTLKQNYNNSTNAQNNWTAAIATAIAKEAKSIGIRWNLAPVCDINSNPKNPVINIRSFGDNKNDVINNCIYYINATQNEHIAACAKHFPGHGDTDIDSHTQIPIINKSLSQLEENEIAPFVAAMKCNVKSIMLGHLSTTAHFPTNAQSKCLQNASALTASLNPGIVRYLRQINVADSGKTPEYWEGIIMTDALDMQAIVELYEDSGYCAFVAGVDVLLMPPNPKLTIQSIVTKIEQAEDNTLQLQLEQSVRRIYKLKQWTKIIPRYTSLSDIKPQLFMQNMQLALKAAYSAADIIADGKSKHLPIPEGAPFAAFSIVQKAEDIQPASRFFTMLAQAVENDCDFGYLDESISEEQLSDIADSVQDVEFLIFALFYKGRGYSSQLAAADKINSIMHTIAEHRDYIIVCFGDPYIAEKLKGSTKILTYSDSFASLAAAVMMLADRKF